jgi:hypothetical protein
MLIFDFITQEEIDELPVDDPSVAFTMFVRIAQRRLGEKTSKLDPGDRGDWELIEEARYAFMNIIIAAAKKYEIDPFTSLSVPRLEDYNFNTHRQFKADLDHYITQLVLDNSSRAKRDSVPISPELKSTIRTYLHHLREAIDRAGDLSESKRNVLLRRLAEFEAELEKKRLNLLAVTVIAITFLSAPGGLGSTADIASKLITNILRAVGEAKLVNDEARRIPSSAEPIAITGPRPKESELIKPEIQRREMDDEIPF